MTAADDPVDDVQRSEIATEIPDHERLEDIQVRLAILETHALDKLDALLTISQTFTTVLLKHMGSEEMAMDRVIDSVRRALNNTDTVDARWLAKINELVTAQQRERQVLAFLAGAVAASVLSFMLTLIFYSVE